MLVKSVLEAISIYWMSIAQIPKGVLEKLHRICFSFLWQGQSKCHSRPWLKLESIAIPKALGGWGLKNIFLFLLSTCSKMWMETIINSLWTEVIIQKYIAPCNLIAWVRRLEKVWRGGSIFWKAIIKSFTLISETLAWRVGDGTSVRLGMDPWPGSGLQDILAPDIWEHLEGLGFLFLHQIVDPNQMTIQRQAWRSGVDLGLPVEDIPEWNRYRRILHESHIHLQDRSDELVWEGDPSGCYTPKAGYVKLCIDFQQCDVKWWWRKVWKLGCPTKARILLWTILENKTPTWDNLQKRNHNGPSWCILCKDSIETVHHLFVSYQFTQSILAELRGIGNKQFLWRGESFEQDLSYWLSDHIVSQYKSLPAIASWGICINRNKGIFEGKITTPQIVASNIMAIAAHFMVVKRTQRMRDIRPETIDQSYPQGYFDGAGQGNHTRCDAGAIPMKKNINTIFKKWLVKHSTQYSSFKILYWRKAPSSK